VYGHDDRVRIVATATATKPEWASHWSHSLLAGVLGDMGISASQVGRILAELDIKPHQVRSWLARPDDPAFWERAADVCGLYLSPPTNALSAGGGSCGSGGCRWDLLEAPPAT